MHEPRGCKAHNKVCSVQGKKVLPRHCPLGDYFQTVTITYVRKLEAPRKSNSKESHTKDMKRGLYALCIHAPEEDHVQEGISYCVGEHLYTMVRMPICTIFSQL
ncbi:hypothetical protein POVWA2_023680 [Plasmodium ovale wallikeri]|uniref:Uncharacterized protein n=1 Tax=Plasmodium ovale wallikeri TaxID=864142 RepID=A0A1A9AIX9_PLAOA|nr:hypothetical protein POVWA2_023680 [Plasmodium ovale wallikeri]SBT56136.1 hypothetical protein POVWA1_074730 [Plasmodium ovale wallikeri]